MKKTVDNRVSGWYNNQRRQEHDTSTPAYGGLAQLGERLHGMQEVSGSIPLFSTKKALYFVGSTVLFFLLKLVFGGCIASPAPFLGFCRRFLYNPQLLTLHRFQKGMFAGRFSAGCCIIPFNVRRKVEVEGNVELITPLLCRSF